MRCVLGKQEKYNGNFKNDLKESDVLVQQIANYYKDFYDELKSLSSWYASMNYEFTKYKEDDLVKLDVLIAWEKVEALSLICHRTQAAYLWWKITKKLKIIQGKIQYTLSALSVVLFLLFITFILPTYIDGVFAKVLQCGALGGLLSIAVGYNALEIDIDANWKTNSLVGGFRIVIAVIASIFFDNSSFAVA